MKNLPDIYKIIRSSEHSTKFSNTGKIDKLEDFRNEYKIATQNYVNYIMNNDISFKTIIKSDDGDTFTVYNTFSMQKGSYILPKYLDYNLISFDTKLSARALSSSMNQSLGIIKSHTKKLIKANQKLQWLKDTEKSFVAINKQIERINKLKSAESFDLENINPELSSKCCSIEYDDRLFNAWIVLEYIGEFYGKIIIPIKFHKHSNELKEDYNMMRSFLICEDNIQLRWEKQVCKKKDGISIGADPGVNRICTFSHIDNKDDFSYSDVLKKICKKRKNSFAYKRALREREILVNKFVNNTDFDNVKEVNLEDNSTIHYKNPTSRYLSHYSYSEIRDKIESKSLESGVQVKKTGSIYKSQRCSKCGWVQCSNRDKSKFYCKKCNLSMDADYNSSINQTLQLISIPLGLISKKYNKEGFYWSSSGLYLDNGQEIRVSDFSCID